jgi:hypothetical protein
MGSGSKKKTTMAKLNRERRLRERQFEKQAKKDARKRAAAAGLVAPSDPLTDDGEGTPPDQAAGEAVPSELRGHI